jgi:thermolysin
VIATDDDNDWTNPAVVDAHVYAGWTYDYFLKRHGRRGIDGFDYYPLRLMIHAAPSAEGGIPSASYYSGVNAIVFGTHSNLHHDASAALDVVAHEYTHGVTDWTWNGIYWNESGALNEAFSDIMATGVEFFFQPPGNGPLLADYVEAEDIFRDFDATDPDRHFGSMADPGQSCTWRGGCFPDHYSRYWRVAFDNGGVHGNSAIADHAFYLLIEGGTNRTSGIHVDGIGPENREQAERIFYRGFTAFLTPWATFSDARAATLQAARELYGAGSREARETAAAWTAVGVE